MRAAALLLLLAVLLSLSAYAGYVIAQEVPQIENAPTLIQFEEMAGLCYPWLILKTGTLLNLETGVTYPGIGGDDALSVECAKNYFIVVGNTGVYTLNRETGLVVDVVFTTPNLIYIGSDSGAVALLSLQEPVVLVHIPGTGDVAVSLKDYPIDVSFSMIDGVPVILYSIRVSPDMVEYRLANPSTDTLLKNTTGSGAVKIDRSTAYIESDGLLVYKITDPTTLSYTLSEYIPLPFTITKIASVSNGVVYAYAYGVLVTVDIAEHAWDIIGSATLTPVGYYVEEANTTYVYYDGSYYPVPGYAVARLGTAVFTNIDTGMGVSGYLWPLKRVNLVAREAVVGNLLIPEDGATYIIAINLPPGVYALPEGSISTQEGVIALEPPEAYYPPVSHGTVQTATPTPNIEYKVAVYPSKYIPLDVIEDVSFIATGAERAVLITKLGAIVYSEYGRSAFIPGTWKWGGVGDYIVLYDGASLRLFDYAGNPIASYYYYSITPPIYATTDGDTVILYYTNRVAKISSDGVDYEYKDVPGYTDPTTGLSVFYYTTPVISLGDTEIPIPVEPGARVEISKYTAAWASWGDIYILSILDGTAYVLKNATGIHPYPLGDYLILYQEDTRTAVVIPYKEWVGGACFVKVITDEDATIYINGEPVGNYTATYYTSCGARLNVTVAKPYYKPASEIVMVPQGGIEVELHPTPLIAEVKLEVVTPQNLTIESVEVSINGERMTWKVGSTIKLVAGLPYTIEVIRFNPDVCLRQTIQTSFEEGKNTLRLTCQLAGSVLALTTKTPVNVEIKDDRGRTVTIVYIEPAQPAYLQVDPGKYTLISNPVSGNYTTRQFEVTLASNQVIYLDVTPYQLSMLKVVASVPNARITVKTENGTVIAEGVGTLEKYVIPGTYTITAEAPGFAPYMDIVTVEPGKSLVVNATLTPIPASPTATPAPPAWQKPEFQVGVTLVVAAVIGIALLLRRRRMAPSREMVVSGVEVSEGGGEQA